MSDIAIRLQNIGERYQIGPRKDTDRTLRETLVDGFAAPFAWGRSLHPRPAARPCVEDTIWARQDISGEINPDHACIQVRPSDGYRAPDALSVRDDILERIGRFDLEVVEVDEIPKTAQGNIALVMRPADQGALDERMPGS